MKKGLLFYYFSSIDQGSHIFWALRDPLHPYHKSEEAKKFGDRIEALYREFDKIIGNVLKKLPSNIPLVILSDHGFAPLRRKVNLNTLLHENGFVRFNCEIDYMDATFIPNYANWNETRAFSIGLNGIYLNLKGREPNGIVKPEEKRAVLNDIKKMLLSVKDEKTGEHPIGNVFQKTIMPGKIFTWAQTSLWGTTGTMHWIPDLRWVVWVKKPYQIISAAGLEIILLIPVRFQPCC